LIGSLEKSVTDTTLGAFNSTVPYALAMLRVSSAVGKSKSDRLAGLGGAIFGRNNCPNTTDALNKSSTNQNGTEVTSLSTFIQCMQLSEASIERFMHHIIDTHDCWLWDKPRPSGYAYFKIVNKNHRAHRVAYQLFIGDIPDGMTLDHTCRVRNCVCPTHLEPIPHGENVKRGGNKIKTHCPQGHEYTPDNTYTYKDMRYCRICKTDNERLRKRMKRITSHY
jgi:hypothetical protein